MINLTEKLDALVDFTLNNGWGLDSDDELKPIVDTAVMIAKTDPVIAKSYLIKHAGDWLTSTVLTDIEKYHTNQ